MFQVYRAVLICVALETFAFGQKPEDIVRESWGILTEMQKSANSSIPLELLAHSECIGVVPASSTAAFVKSSKRANGVISCATEKGWSAPLFIHADGGSWSSMAGKEAVVFLVMNEKARNQITESRYTIGADAAAMAGPVGRDSAAMTDAVLRAQTLSYSFFRGVLAGRLLEGTAIQIGREDNWAVYGRSTSPKSVLDGEISMPVSFQAPPFPPIPPPPKRRRR